MNELSSLHRFIVKFLLSLILISCLLCLLFRKLRDLIAGETFSRPAKIARVGYSQNHVEKLMNKCVLLNVIPSDDDTLHGYPLEVQFSCKATTCQCLVLTNVPCRSLHNALVKDYQFLKQFLLAKCETIFNLSASESVIKLSVDLKPPIPPPPHPTTTQSGQKRDEYALVIATLSDHDPFQEEIAISCHVMHVRLFADEEYKTGTLYTFWKTNWNRTLTPQPLFSTSEEFGNGPIADHPSLRTNPSIDTNQTDSWKPSCCICLSVVEHSLRVLLPCRHAGFCGDCYETFTQRLLAPSTGPADRIPRCPLCRTNIMSVLCLPSDVTPTSV